MHAVAGGQWWASFHALVEKVSGTNWMGDWVGHIATIVCVYINYQLWCPDYYLFIKYYSHLHVSSIKCSSSGGYSCIHAAYGTVTLYESSWWPVGTQLEWELTGGGRLLVGVFRHPLKLCTYKPPGTLIESDSTICCMCTNVSSWRWALEARNM